jgi:hypothetical protein
MFGGTGQAAWRRSIYCSTGACVEVMRVDDVVMVRNSEAPDHNLRVDADAWTAFLGAVRADAFAASGDFSGGLMESGE